jgi:hypothetical protein
MKKLLEELNIEELTADCVRRKIKMMKTVYSQEVNKTERKQISFSSPCSNKVDISLNRKATVTRTPVRITSVEAMLFYTGIQ